MRECPCVFTIQCVPKHRPLSGVQTIAAMNKSSVQSHVSTTHNAFPSARVNSQLVNLVAPVMKDATKDAHATITQSIARSQFPAMRQLKC